MNILWKGAAAVALACAGLGAAAAPAQAQYYGHRDGWRGDRDHRWDRNRRWDNRRHYRSSHRYDRPRWRSGYRQRCWTEWRYSHYRDRRVRVRICR